VRPTQGNTAQGTVTFLQEGNQVRVVVDIASLSPGQHGIHIHEYGDCSGADALTAGSHFNPTNSAHGCPDSKERHLGDLGNVEADRTGRARADFIVPKLEISGTNSIIGRSIVVKAKPDDCTTQPAGGSGARIACGVIGISALPSE
jgi:Cu-Zn family superoxide dismutase